jgi:hypothetical protein
MDECCELRLVFDEQHTHRRMICGRHAASAPDSPAPYFLVTLAAPT